MNFTFKTDIEIEVRVKNYKPKRAAPTCQDPSCIHFTDDGDNAEFEDFTVYLANRDITDLLYQDQLKTIIEKIFEEQE